MIVDIFGEKTEITGRKDKLGAPLQYGDKVVAICNKGYTKKAYFLGTTPSGHTDKVLHLGGMYPSRPYRGVLKYDWKVSNSSIAIKQDEETIEILKKNMPSEL